MTTKLSFSELLKRAKTEKIAIHTPTEEQAKALLKALVKKGYKWISGYKLTSETCYEDYKENTCYDFELNNKICYCRLNFYQQCGYTIIEFKAIDFKENA